MAVATRPASGQVRLLDDALAGDSRAFGLLLRSHHVRMRSLAWKMLNDPDRTDDVLQEAYVKAWFSLGGFRRGSDLGTWLYRITYNACLDELRRGTHRPVPCDWSDIAEEPAVVGPDPERRAVTSDSVARLLAVLPPDQRVAIVLVDGEGFDNQAAADILGVAVGTVASRLSRARATLRAAFGEEDR